MERSGAGSPEGVWGQRAASSDSLAPSVPPAPPQVRTGAFGRVHVRWLAFWVGVGGLALLAVAGVLGTFGVSVGDDLLSIQLYLVIAGWVLISVWWRAGVRLGVLFRWPKLGSYWWVVAGMFVVQLVFSLSASMVTSVVAPGLDDAVQDVGQGNLLLVLLGLVILPPLVEETVFRGVLIERLAVRWRLLWAIVASALLFGALHADPVGAGVFGVVATLLYLRTGSLWPAILIHLANNLLVLTLTRGLAGAESGAETPDTATTLTSAAFLAAVSIPFLVWFARVHWPTRRQLTPYQAYEVMSGLPELTVPGAAWSVRPRGTVRLTVTNSHLVVSEVGAAPARPVATLGFESVAGVYAAPAPGQEMTELVVVVVNDGTWSGFQVGGGAQRPTRKLAAGVRERIDAARYREWVASWPDGSPQLPRV